MGNIIIEDWWEPKERHLPLKYHERALIPHDAIKDDAANTVYVLSGGERVYFNRCETRTRTAGGADDVYFDEVSRVLYGVGFDKVCEAWDRRQGCDVSSGNWCIIDMVRL